MKIAICVDDNGGRLFNGRRQSRDRVLLEDLVRESGGRLFIREFSRALFAGVPEAEVREDFHEDGLYFLEAEPLSPLADRIERLIVYRWNRIYPADVHLDLDPESIGLTKVSSEDFPGFSHEKITKDVYCI